MGYPTIDKPDEPKSSRFDNFLQTHKSLVLLSTVPPSAPSLTSPNAHCPETFENFLLNAEVGDHPHARPHYRSNHAVQHPRGTVRLLYRSPAIAAPGTASRHSVAERLQTVCPRRTTASPHALCTFSLSGYPTRAEHTVP